jgi:hypothetical protein
MITLPAPISVTPPPITLGDKSVKTFAPIELKAIDYSVNYDDSRQLATAMIKGVNRTIILWQGADYVAAGEFTTAETDARVSEILGSDPATFLTNIFQNPQIPTARKPVAPSA